jgi:hypothetical protein
MLSSFASASDDADDDDDGIPSSVEEDSPEQHSFELLPIASSSPSPETPTTTSTFQVESSSPKVEPTTPAPTAAERIPSSPPFLVVKVETPPDSTPPIIVEPLPLPPPPPPTTEVEPEKPAAVPQTAAPPADTATPAPAAPPTIVTNTTSTTNVEEDPRFQQLQHVVLRLREEQLANKSVQLTKLQQLLEQQEHELRHKLQETKDEAKKRILRARERCEAAAEAKLQQSQSKTSESSTQQDQMIAGLRREGETLARKQAAMEQAVRTAKGELQDLEEPLDAEHRAKTQALEKSAKLEADL